MYSQSRFEKYLQQHPVQVLELLTDNGSALHTLSHVENGYVQILQTHFPAGGQRPECDDGLNNRPTPGAAGNDPRVKCFNVALSDNRLTALRTSFYAEEAGAIPDLPGTPTDLETELHAKCTQLMALLV